MGIEEEEAAAAAAAANEGEAKKIKPLLPHAAHDRLAEAQPPALIRQQYYLDLH